MRTITPTELLPAVNAAQTVMGDEELVVVYGACYSVSFIPNLSDPTWPNRVIITSSSADEVSHRGVIDPADTIRDSEVFVTELFRRLGQGLGIFGAFTTASNRTTLYTSDSTVNGEGGATPQTPFLDANGDGVGTTALALTTDVGSDGANVFTLTLGFGIVNPGVVGKVTASPTVQAADTLTSLTAEAAEHNVLHEAWLEVKVPTYSGGSIPAGGESDLQQEVSLEQVDPDGDPVSAVYTWSNFGTTFDTAGDV